MSNTPDNPERDPRLSAAWREHSAEMPSAKLDAAILAAAHRAVGSTPHDADNDARAAGRPARAATGPQRWWMPLAAAATIGAIALGVLQTAPRDTPIVAQSATDMPSAGVARESPSVPAAAPAQVPAAPVVQAPPSDAGALKPQPLRDKVIVQDRKDSLREGPRDAAREERDTRAAVPPPPAPKPAGKLDAQNFANEPAPRAQAPAPAAAPQPFPAEKKTEAVDALSEQGARAPAAPASARVAASASDEARPRDSDTRQRENPAQLGAAASGAAVLAKTRPNAEAGAQALDIDAAIARIRKLHDDGKLADAAKELIALRAAVPDADSRLAPDLRAWAATVKP